MTGRNIPQWAYDAITTTLTVEESIELLDISSNIPSLYNLSRYVLSVILLVIYGIAIYTLKSIDQSVFDCKFWRETKHGNVQKLCSWLNGPLTQVINQENMNCEQVKQNVNCEQVNSYSNQSQPGSSDSSFFELLIILLFRITWNLSGSSSLLSLCCSRSFLLALLSGTVRHIRTGGERELITELFIGRMAALSLLTPTLLQSITKGFSLISCRTSDTISQNFASLLLNTVNQNILTTVLNVGRWLNSCTDLLLRQCCWTSIWSSCRVAFHLSLYHILCGLQLLLNSVLNAAQSILSHFQLLFVDRW